MAATGVVSMRVPNRSWRSAARAVRIIWRRDLIRFVDDPTRIAAWLIQPLLFLFVMGTGLQALSDRSTHGVRLTTFIFPGVVAMALIYSAMFSAASLVWDRELGFLKELMVAPIRRSSIILGKCLGGATIAASQGIVVLLLAGLVHVPYDPMLLLSMLGLEVLVAFSVTAFGVFVATAIKQAQTFTNVMQMLVIPMIFTSGALYPISGLPTWLGVLSRVNPLTYAVDPMRRLVFTHLNVSAGAEQLLAPGVTWWGWHVPVLLETLMLLVMGLALIAASVVKFSRTE